MTSASPGSSSITSRRSRRTAAIVMASAGAGRQLHLEAGAAAGMVGGADRSAELVHDLVADGEAEAGARAGLLGREKGIEDACQVLGLDPRSVVANRQGNPCAVGAHSRFDPARPVR